ncbi:CHROMATIN REMODELING 24-like protein [Drosera capensis]
MAEPSTATATKSKKTKPLSLNERHTMLLKSASHSTHHPPPPLSSRFNPQEDEIPRFSGIVDFDSPIENEREQQKQFGEDEIPRFSGIVDFDSPIEKDKDNKKEKAFGEDKCDAAYPNDAGSFSDEISQYSGIPNYDSHIETEKENTVKVKIQGRRRLCKAATKNDDIDKVDEKEILEVIDFSSPVPSKKAVNVVDDADDGGGSEIRSILNDLSSKLEVLSIQKIGRPRDIDQSSVLIDDTLGEARSAVIDSIDYDLEDGSCVRDGVNNWKFEAEASNKYEDESFSIEVNARKNHGKGNGKGETKKAGRKLVVPDEDASLSSKNGKSQRGRGKHGSKLNDAYGVLGLVGIESDVDEGDSDDVWNEENYITLKGPTSTYRLPSKIGNMLYPHQRDGLRWLWSLYCQGKSGILGDDMGLGKTMQICGFLAGMFDSDLIKRVIVVAPKTLIPHWIKELSVVGLSEKIREYFGTCPKARQYELNYVLQDKGVLLTTYDILRNNTKKLAHSNFVQDEDDEDAPIWDYMILDEGHLIKNPSTQRAKSLLEIPCSYRILISGTPLQNNLKELWALFNFCCPDLLGDKKEFKAKYEYPILRGNEKRASDREKRIGSNVAQELRERIRPYFLRRMKDEVFGEHNEENSGKLSKKNEIIVWLRLTPCQRHLYEAFLRSEIVLSAFDGSPLAALTILKKICDHPSLLTKRAAEDVLEGMDSMLNKEDIDLAEKLAMHVADISEEDDLLESHGNVSCKISFILSLLQNLVPEGHNVLIFSQTRKMLNIIQDSLVSNGFEYQRIDGTTKAADRLKIVNDFQEGHGTPIFLLTTQVGGLGLTLTNADRVIVVDPAWNPSSDNQSVDRAYRIGQTKDVIVYRLMTCGTIEEKIYRKQIFKGGLFRTATEHKEQTRYFSQQDLRELFSLPKDGFDISPTQQQLHEEHSHQITLSDSLKDHVEFLESLGIGGVSHHSLLYSKTETVPPMPEEEEAMRRETSTNYWNSRSIPERNVDGAGYAFNPKDVQLGKNKTPPHSSSKLTESDIKERVTRLSQLLSNQATLSRLPDGGEKIQKQILELKSMLKTITASKTAQVIDLDNIADELQRSLKVK